MTVRRPSVSMTIAAAFLLAGGWMRRQQDAGRRREILVDGALIAAVLAAVLFRWSPVLPAASGAASLPARPALMHGIPVAIACALVFAVLLFVLRREPNGIVAGESSGRLFRRFVAPATALAIGVVTLDAALRPPLLPATGIALAVAAALMAVRVGHLLEMTRRIPNARLFEQVDTMSKTDPLTGLSNRRRLELDLEREFAAATRGRKLIAVMFDLNGFKDYNDRYGHVAGDEVLRLFADVLASQTRSANPPARYGGDEFVVLLTDTDLRGARLFTERVRLQFSQKVAGLERRAVSVAAGFARFEPAMRAPEELIDAADRALYASKADRPRTG